MEEIKMQAKLRKEVGRGLNKFRKNGLIPAVLYGRGIKNINLWINQKEFEKSFQTAGENTIVKLSLSNKELPVLIHEVQYDNLTGKVSHVDLFQIRMDEKIETEIPLEFKGEAPAVKEQSGTLVVNIKEVPVRCLPSDIPSKFSLDIGQLKTFEDRILIKDLDVDKDKVEILMEDDNVIALVSPPRSEEELESLEEKVEEDVSQVEGIQKEEKNTSENETQKKTEEE